jgi:outer membrane protein assembly factor BamB
MRILNRLTPAIAVVVAALAAVVFGMWLWAPLQTPVSPRLPGADQRVSEPSADAAGDLFAARTLIEGTGLSADLPGAWPCFRGAQLDGIQHETTRLARAWPPAGPRVLWSVEAGEGYAGPAIADGRVYLMDYERTHQRDALRCLSLLDGKEIWRFSYPNIVKRNHGMTRTVPAVAAGLVVAMGPKCHVLCVDAAVGEFKWGLDLPREFGATVPPWYTGQCPLIDGDAVLLAPGGPDALLLCVELNSGRTRWRTPNPNGWKMTHSSVVPFQVDDDRFYLYAASGGVVAVAASGGSIAWESTEWKIHIATVPSPVVLDGPQVFFTGGYNAGSLLLEFSHGIGALTAREVYRLKPGVFGATQHSPIWFDGALYGIRADGRLVCLLPNGTIAWESETTTTFGLGPLIVADGTILAFEERGRLDMVEATQGGYRSLATAQIIDGHECWAPLAIAGNRLLARDLTRLLCLELPR